MWLLKKKITKKYDQKCSLNMCGVNRLFTKLPVKSTPGLRKYVGHDAIKPVIGGLGISIVTTNQGVMTNKQARARNVGGELLCTVW